MVHHVVNRRELSFSQEEQARPGLTAKMKPVPDHALAQLLAEKGIRANAVASGPIWTALIPSTLPEVSLTNLGKQVPMKRVRQPAELAAAFVVLADPLSSDALVTGGKPSLLAGARDRHWSLRIGHALRDVIEKPRASHANR